ncbi:hypothetical protein EWB00_005354 [Schistosoma japonicum]|uniref:DUF5741 domain-containing protein n=1 Tax=Schistosoma japonicum TaxID=6182 RepID=A0A4Z2D1S2_SCHJA|nr:hypothetical protein EWB00_005354 [Schistosoma japonicum]
MAGNPSKSNAFQVEHCHSLNSSATGRASSLEETLAEMRRENFRLRLLLYNYERVYRQANAPQDLESSRIFAAESENILLKEALSEKDTLLNFSSKTNDQLRVQIDILKQKSEKIEDEWQRKYDILHAEFQCAQEKVRTLEMSILAKDTESAKCKNEFQSSIARLEAELAFSQHNNKRYRREIQMFRTEADDLRATLETVNKTHLSIDVEDLKPDNIHTSEQNLWNQSPQCNLKTPTTVSSLSPSFSASTGHEGDIVRIPMKDFSSLHNQIPSEESYAKLTDRLNSARHLILELGNEKLRTDKLINSMKLTHEKEILAMKDKCELIEAQLLKENQLHHDELCRKDAEIERLNNQISELIKKLDTSLSVREKLHFDLDNLNEQFIRTKRECTDLQDQLNLLRISDQKSVETVNVDKNNESNVICTPCTNCVTEYQETGSTRRLRNLYDLIHDLMRRLNDVRFTQHSVVEMINRSLATVDIEHSHDSSSLRKAVSVCGGLNRLSSNNILLSLSRADATCGGFNTLYENMNNSITNPATSSLCDHQTAESVVSTELNETVAELRSSCPKSPISCSNLKCNSAENSYADITKPLHKTQTNQKSTMKIISLHKKLFSTPQYKNQAGNFVESSLCEELKSSAQNLKKSEVSFHSFTDGIHDVSFDRMTRKPMNAGDLTMVEWEHKDIFERLTVAMSKLRDAIEECSDISSEFWDLDVKKHLSVLLTSQIDSFHSHINQPNDSIDDGGDSVDLDAKVEADKVVSQSAERSARFDSGQLPPYDPIGFISQNEEASLSQLYGSAWRHPMGISMKSLDMKNPKMFDEQSSNHTCPRSDQPSKESSNHLSNNHNCEKLPYEVRDLNNTVTSLEAENSTLKKIIADLQNKIKIYGMPNQNDRVSNEIIHIEPDSSISVAPHAMSENQRIEGLSDVLAQCQEENCKLKNECDRLRNLISPSTTKENLDIRNVELSDNSTIIHTITERLQTIVDPDCKCVNVIDLVDAASSELVQSRESITNLKDQMCRLEKYLSESVSLYDYQSLENEVDSVRQELQKVMDQTNQYKIDVQYVCDNLAPLLSLNKSSLKVLVDDVMKKLIDHQLYSNNLTNELQSVLLSVNCQVPETLDECIEMIKTNLSNCKLTIDQLKADKMCALNMIKELAPQSEGLCTLSDYIRWFIGIFNEKQCNFEDLEQNYVVIQKSLYESVQKYENLETTTGELSDKLQASQSRVESLEMELADIIKSHVPMDEYESVIMQINVVEENLCKTQSKVIEYEQEHEFIKELVESTLLKQSICLKADIEELCTNFNMYRKSLDLNSLTSNKCKICLSRTEGSNGRLVIEHTSFVNIPDNPSLMSDEIINTEYYELEDRPTKETTSPDKMMHIAPQNKIQSIDVGKPLPSFRKYNELKAAAFEIRNKLISRTQKLETALKEIERLRGVIQQDKERANSTLEEVKELRQKVLRKNQRIRDLESDVARLRACSTKFNVGSVQISDSSARLLSDPEQRRGCISRLESLGQVDQANEIDRIYGSTTASLLHCPATSSDSTENLRNQLADCTVSCDSVSVDNTHGPVSSVNNDELAIALSNECSNGSRCHNLNKLLPELHNTTMQLKELITLNLSNEDSLLDALNYIDKHASLSVSSISNSQSLVDDNHVKISSSENIGLSDQSGMKENMRTFIESIYHARVRLHYYVRKMDQLCMSFVNHCEKCSLKSQKISSNDIDKSIDLLVGIIRRLESLCNQDNLFDGHVVESIIQDCHQLLERIQYLSAEGEYISSDFSRKDSKDISQFPPEVESSRNPSDCQKLKSQVKHYRRKYHQLLYSVDAVTKNLADTTDVISSTRTRLENVAGLSPITDHSASKN